MQVVWERLHIELVLHWIYVRKNKWSLYLRANKWVLFTTITWNMFTYHPSHFIPRVSNLWDIFSKVEVLPSMISICRLDWKNVIVEQCRLKLDGSFFCRIYSFNELFSLNGYGKCPGSWPIVCHWSKNIVRIFVMVIHLSRSIILVNDWIIKANRK